MPELKRFASSFKNEVEAKGDPYVASVTDDSLRSYITLGDARFAGEAVEKDEAGNVTENRSQLIQRIRDNILQRMREENADSDTEANKMQTRHNKQSNELIYAIENLEGNERILKKNYLEIYVNQARLNYDPQNPNANFNWTSVLQKEIDSLKTDLAADTELKNSSVQQGQNIAAQNAAAPAGAAGQPAPAPQPVPNAPAPPAAPAPVDPASIQPVNIDANDIEEADELGERQAQSVSEVTDATLNTRQWDINTVEAQQGELNRQNKKLGFFDKRKVRKRINQLENNNTSAIKTISTKKSAIKKMVSDWEEERKKYASESVKKHYDTYDSLAKSYYEATREHSLSTLDPDNHTAQDEADKKASRAINANAAKNIKEYIGVYNAAAVNRLLERIDKNPYIAITEALIPKVDYKGEREQNPAGEDNISGLIKTHKKILMYSEEQNGVKTRYKFSSDFTGYKSRWQVDAQTKTKTDRRQRGASQYAEEDGVNLEADEKDLEGRFLVSENNAEILTATRKKREGVSEKKLHGFYLNGEFFTDEDDLNGGRVSRKEDMAFFGKRNWKKQESAEKLRAAIRKSPFFKHVNARTIQYYAGYNVDDDFGKDIREKTDKLYEKENTDETTLLNLVNGAARNFRNSQQAQNAQIDFAGLNIPKSVLGDVLAAYIIDKGNLDYGAILADPFFAYVKKTDSYSLHKTMIRLLAQSQNPALWEAAGQLILHDKIPLLLRTSYIKKKKSFPHHGELMRTTLLKELVKHDVRPGSDDEKDDKKDEKKKSAKEIMMDLMSRNIPAEITKLTLKSMKRDPLGDILDIVSLFTKEKATFSLDVAKENSMNQRGKMAWVKRNVLNGTILQKLISHMKMGEGAYKAANGVDDDVHGKFDLAMNISDLLASADRLKISMGIVEAGVETDVSKKWVDQGGEATKDDKNESYLTQTVASDAVTMSKLLKLMEDIDKITGKFFEWMQGKNKPEQKNNLQSLDYGEEAFIQFCDFMNKLLDFADSFKKEAGVMAPRDKDGKDAWDKVMAGIDLGLNSARNAFNFMSHVANASIASYKTERVTAAEKDIRTALYRYASRNPAVLEERNELELPLSAGLDEDQQLNPQDYRGETEFNEMGLAAESNSHIQYFLALTKMQANKEMVTSGIDAFNDLVKEGRDVANYLNSTTEDPNAKIAAAVFNVAPYVVDFIKSGVGLAHDIGNFKTNIGTMLGSEEHWDTYYFDEVLERETGIVNKYYLMDLAKIFTAIDTHVLLKKNDKTEGEKDLAIRLMKSFYSNVNAETVKKAKLSDMMAKVGFEANSDWRAVLRYSLTDH